MDLFKKAVDPVTLPAIISILGISLFIAAGSWMFASATMTGVPTLDALQFAFAHAATGQEPTAIAVMSFGLIQTTLIYIFYGVISTKARPASDQRYITKQLISADAQMFKTKSK